MSEDFKMQGKKVTFGDMDNKGYTDKERVLEKQLARKFLTDDVNHMNHDETQIFNKLTVDHLVPREAANSYLNHKWVFGDLFQPKMQELKNVWSRQMEQWKNYFAWHLGKRRGWGEDLGDHLHSRKGPCIVMGSGPSLDAYIQDIAENWEGGIITSTSQYSTLYSYGRSADFVVGYDYRDTPGKMLVPHPVKAHKKTDFVVMPTLRPDLLQHWKGRRLYFRTFDPYIRFYEEVLPVGYLWIGATIAPYACSLGAEIALARGMGYDPIFLFGADLSHPGGYTYFTRRLWTGKTWKTIATPPQYKPTQGGLHKFYSETITQLGWLDAGNVITCSEGPLDDVFPKVKGNTVISQQGVGQQIDMHKATKQEIRDRIGPILAGQGGYWVTVTEADGTEGYRFFKCDPRDWEVSMPMYMGAMANKDARIDIEANVAQIKKWTDEFKRTGGKWK